METKNSETQAGNPEGRITSGSTLSYWVDSVQPMKFQPIAGNHDTDVVVIGAGIAGITTAYCLAKSGKNVVVMKTVLLEVVKPAERQPIWDALSTGMLLKNLLIVHDIVPDLRAWVK